MVSIGLSSRLAIKIIIMSFSKAMKLVFSDMMFKVIVTIMIVVLTLQSTIRDYDYVIDVERLDSNNDKIYLTYNLNIKDRPDVMSKNYVVSGYLGIIILI